MNILKLDIKSPVVNISLDIMKEHLDSIRKDAKGNSTLKTRLKPEFDAKIKALEQAIVTLGHFGGVNKLTYEEQQKEFGFENPYK